MSESSHQPWARVAIIIGLIYALVGITFAMPAAHVHIWRLSAWLVSAAAYAAHICYERFRLRATPLGAALHVALAAAFGAFGLAISANIHSLRLGSANQHSRLLALSLAIWPLLVSAPAFCAALVASWVLVRTSSQAETR